MFGAITVVLGLYSIFRTPKIKDLTLQVKKIKFKRKYLLYYLLSFFSGARRQIFVVFAIFLLVEKYKFGVEYIALLFIINNIIAYYINPLIARGINRFGEKILLSTEYFLMIFVFLGYAFIDNQYAVSALYIIDHIFFSFAIALNTYMQKTVEPEDIASTVAAGFTINHTSAVIIPVIGGALWLINPQYSFIAGVSLAVISLVLSRFIKINV